jgi:transcriptional regulator with XRE-family HTH domain
LYFSQLTLLLLQQFERITLSARKELRYCLHMANQKKPQLDLGPTGKAVAANVKRIREARGLTLRELANRITGVNLDASALTRIEGVHRRVTADELTALAVALDANVSALILPATDEPSATIEITGGGPVSADMAWDWADGHQPLTTTPTQEEQAQFELVARPPMRRLLFAGINQLGASELFERLSPSQIRRLLKMEEEATNME